MQFSPVARRVNFHGVPSSIVVPYSYFSIHGLKIQYINTNNTVQVADIFGIHTFLSSSDSIRALSMYIFLIATR